MKWILIIGCILYFLKWAFSEAEPDGSGDREEDRLDSIRNSVGDHTMKDSDIY